MWHCKYVFHVDFFLFYTHTHTQGVILVYDITVLNSFTMLTKWMTMLSEVRGGQNICTIHTRKQKYNRL